MTKEPSPASPPGGDPGNAAPPPRSRLGRNAFSMGIGVACSRVTGLLREQSFAFLFGAGPATEAFVAAFRIPNFFRDLLAENIASAAVVPSYIGVKAKEGAEAASRFAASALALILSGALVIVALGILLAEPICAMVAPGFVGDPERFGLMVTLTRWLFPFLGLIAAAAFFQAIQNAEGRFFLPAFSTAGLNVAFIAAGWAFTFWADPPIVGMAWGALVGGLTALALLLPGYRAAVGNIRLGTLAHPELRKMLFLAAPVVVGVAATNVNVLVNTLLATLTGQPGALAWLNFGYRVMHLPLGLVAVSLGTAALPALARAFEAKDPDRYRDTLGQALGYALELAVPAAVGCVLLRDPIIAALFEYGRFTSADVTATGLALAAYAVGIPAFSWNRILAPAFYARKESRIPVQVGLFSVAANITLNLAALAFGYGFLGIALSASLAGYLQSASLLVLLRGRIGGLGRKRLLAGAGRTLVALSAMIGVLAALARLPALSSLPVLIEAVVSVSAGGGVYLLVLWALKRATR